MVLCSVLPEAAKAPTLPLNPATFKPAMFRAMFATFAPIQALIVQSVDVKHWNAVSYLIKADIDGWVKAVASHDKLRPFTTMILALAEEPHPLPNDIHPGTNFFLCAHLILWPSSGVHHGGRSPAHGAMEGVRIPHRFGTVCGGRCAAYEAGLRTPIHTGFDGGSSG